MPRDTIRFTRFTTAPAAYDHGTTRELSPDAGRDNRDLVIRKVSILRENLDWQEQRLPHGLHGCVPEWEAERFSTIWRLRKEVTP